MKKIFIVFFILLLITSLTIVSSKITVVRHSFVQMIWKGIHLIDNWYAVRAVLPDGVIILSDIPYLDNNNNKNLLDVYYPETTESEMPVIVYIHGGGFIAGDKLFTRKYAMNLAAEGYVVFNINYRID